MKANRFCQPVCPRHLKLAAFFLFCPLVFFGQSLTGLWTGALSNDSATVRKDQLFEIALTEYKGKVYGFSRSEFIVDDTLYYIVKRVKGTIEGDFCEVEDDEIVSYNFKGKLDKGVKVTSVFRRNNKDSAWYLDGTWKTNATKKYYAVTGTVKLREEQDLAASKIFPHLEELNLAQTVAFYKDRVEGPAVVRIAKPETIITAYNSKTELKLASNETAGVQKPVMQRAEIKGGTTAASNPVTLTDLSADPDQPATETPAFIPGVKKPIAEVARTDIKEIPAASVTVTPAETNKQAALNPIPDMSAVVDPLNRPVNDLPKTETKRIHTESVAISPAVTEKQQAVNAIPDMSAVVDPLSRPANDLPKTETKNIPATPTVTATVTATSRSRAENRIPPAVAPVTDQRTNKETVSTSTVNKQPIPAVTTPVQKPVATVVPNNSTASVSNKPPATGNKTENIKPATSNTAAVPTTKTQPATQQEKPAATVSTVTPVIPVARKPLEEIKTAGAMVGGRKTEFSQIVNFKSDSIQISLYDNGEIDGDTVSLYLNGRVEMLNVGLKASATRKTIHISPGNEDFTLVLYAENLGKYPPNTGLLVVHDGDDVYNLRFSSDFQKNAGIIFRRK